MSRRRRPLPHTQAAARRHAFLAIVAIEAGFLRQAVAFDWTVFGGGSSQAGGSAAALGRHATNDLTSDELQKHLKDHTMTAVLFYAPWCFYSQQVMPQWDTAAQKLAIHDPPVRLVKVDANRWRGTAEKHQISGYPTIKLFADNSVFEYDSSKGRSWQQIVKWVNKHMDADHILKDVEDCEHFLHDNDLTVVGLFPDGYESSDFQKSTRHFEDVTFAEARGSDISKQVGELLGRHASLTCETVPVGRSKENTRSLELPRENMDCQNKPSNPQRPEWTDSFEAAVSGLNVTVKRTDSSDGWDQNLQLKCCDKDMGGPPKHTIPVPSIVMFMPHDERFAIYDGDLKDQHALDRWIQARRTPMVFRLTQETASKLFEGGPEKTPVVFVMQRSPDKALEDTIQEAAKGLRGRANFCLTGVDDPMERRLAELVGADEGALPVISLVETNAAGGGGGPFHTAKKYRLEGPATKDSIVKFLEGYESGSLKPYLKSEPEPTEEDLAGSPLGILVGTTFKATARDEAKDVLVNFYAPWCGFCRKFEPVYKDLAKTLKHVTTLKVMKLDATRNEVEGMEIRAFPTVVLFPAGGGNDAHYEGERSVPTICDSLEGALLSV
eukprot:TRINITY_DN37785_c0_g1_i1.p1 TRINITY_DN37785_c0_g1~~TRINITY_DN37785_c0_g1_i1.p1  ORF type:complete len:609 (+),score=151.54 TRINITY_DN37785_c0_g1_i1:69-1895(+)